MLESAQEAISFLGQMTQDDLAKNRMALNAIVRSSRRLSAKLLRNFPSNTAIIIQTFLGQKSSACAID